MEGFGKYVGGKEKRMKGEGVGRGESKFER